MVQNDGGGALFASYNIHKCVGLDRRFDPARILEVICEIDPDVIALQEVDRRFGDRAGLLDLAALERRTGLVAVSVADRRHRGHGWHGNLMLARGGSVAGLRRIALPGHEPRGALIVDLDLGCGPVRVVAAHLGLLRQARLLQVEALITAAHAGCERPLVLMGDLNEWRRRRRSALRAFAPGFGPAGPGAPSFPAYFPVLALDRIFARPHHILAQVGVHDTPLARRASDHLPVKARIRIGAKPRQTEPLRPACETLPFPPASQPHGVTPRRIQR